MLWANSDTSLATGKMKPCHRPSQKPGAVAATAPACWVAAQAVVRQAGRLRASSRGPCVEVERGGVLVGDGEAGDDQTEGGQHHAADQHRDVLGVLRLVLANAGDEQAQPADERGRAERNEPAHRAWSRK